MQTKAVRSHKVMEPVCFPEESKRAEIDASGILRKDREVSALLRNVLRLNGTDDRVEVCGSLSLGCFGSLTIPVGYPIKHHEIGGHECPVRDKVDLSKQSAISGHVVRSRTLSA